MKQRSDRPDGWDVIRERITGLGERSFRKSYYPELQRRLAELERFRTLLDQSNDAIFLVDVPSGRLVDVNQSACQQLRLSRQEVLARTLYALTRVVDGTPMTDLLNGGAGGATRATVRTTLSVRNGDAMPVEITARLVTLEGGTYAVVAARDLTDRTRAEADRIKAAEAQAARGEAEAGRRRIEHILETIKDGFFALDRQWRFTYVNREAERLLQRARDDILGKNIWEQFPETVKLPFFREYHRAMSEQTPVDFEAFYPPLAIWVEVHAHPSDDGLSVYCHDVTQRRQAAEALRDSEERLRAIMDNTTAVVYVKDTKGRLTFVNREYEKLFKTTRERVIGQTDHDVLPKSFADVTRANDLTIIARGTAMECEELIPLDDGVHTYISFKFPLRDSHGDVHAVCGVSTDITERKRAEEERGRLLREMQRRASELDATIRAIPDMVVIYDETGRVLRGNPAAEREVPYAPDERTLPLAERLALGRVQTAASMPFTSDEFPVTRALRGETVQGVIVTTRTASGKTMWRSTSAAPIRAVDGTPLGAVSVFTDITMLHDLQEWLQDVIRAVSHDLRTPLMVILAQSRRLMRLIERGAASRETAGSLETIITAIRKMDGMITELVESARLDSGQLRLDMRPVNLNAFTSDLLRRTQGVLNVGRIHCAFPNDLPPALADADRLERIFVNLLTNAVKYSPADTVVTVRAARTGDDIIVSIADRGPGIAPAEQGHVFERFYRSRTTKKRDGLGLGLYITRMLVEAHDGRIWVESEPGNGSTFSFTLRCA